MAENPKTTLKFKCSNWALAILFPQNFRISPEKLPYLVKRDIVRDRTYHACRKILVTAGPRMAHAFHFAKFHFRIIST